MTLVQAWIDSVQLLKPKNLKLFAMVTLKSISETYKLLFKYFWWIVLMCILLLVYALSIINLSDKASLALYAQINGVAYLLYTILFMGVCFIARPSIAKKDCAYLRAQYKKIILYWFIWVLFFTASSITRLFMPIFYLTMSSVWYIFTILFFADSLGGPKNFLRSIGRAFKMILFNLPLVLLVSVLFTCFKSLFYFGMKKGIMLSVSQESMAQSYVALGTIVNTLGILLLPIGICTYTNIYIKKLHDQFDVYVQQPQ